MLRRCTSGRKKGMLLPANSDAPTWRRGGGCKGGPGRSRLVVEGMLSNTPGQRRHEGVSVPPRLAAFSGRQSDMILTRVCVLPSDGQNPEIVNAVVAAQINVPWQV